MSKIFPPKKKIKNGRNYNNSYINQLYKRKYKCGTSIKIKNPTFYLKHTTFGCHLQKFIGVLNKRVDKLSNRRYLLKFQILPPEELCRNPSLYLRGKFTVFNLCDTKLTIVLPIKYDPYNGSCFHGFLTIFPIPI